MILERILPLIGSFRDQVVMITGASSGIGRETALSFARQGAAVALVARRRILLEQLASEIEQAGGRSVIVPADVTDARAVRASVNRVRRKWGRIDIVVNNAGILVPAAVEELKARDLEAMLRVNVFGALLVMQAVLPLMRSQGSGTIINVASLAGRRGVSPLGGYCATKFALVGLTEALRTELDGTKIHVGLVMPGVVDTPMAESVNQGAAEPLWPSFLNMPAEWVVSAILLAARFHLREIAVPPGAATMEVLSTLVPGITDSLIRWSTSASRLLAGSATRKPPTKRRR
jgi:short-subunit dehydrogenase